MSEVNDRLGILIADVLPHRVRQGDTVGPHTIDENYIVWQV